MLRISETATRLGLKSKLAVKKITRQLQKNGLDNIYTGVSKNGIIGIIGANADGFTKEAHIIKPDGQKILKTYRRINSTDKASKAFNRVIETWDTTRRTPIFVEKSTLFYNGHTLPYDSKLLHGRVLPPDLISTMRTDKGCDGVEIVEKMPFAKYAQYYMKKH